jgi:hypothetical protein
VTAEDPMIVGVATVFVATDIAKSTKHYRDVLGRGAGHGDRRQEFAVTRACNHKGRRSRLLVAKQKSSSVRALPVLTHLGHHCAARVPSKRAFSQVRAVVGRRIGDVDHEPG